MNKFCEGEMKKESHLSCMMTALNLPMALNTFNAQKNIMNGMMALQTGLGQRPPSTYP